MIAIRHTGIVVKDLDKAMHFYVDILGLSVKKSQKESGEYLDNLMGIGNVTVKTIKMSANDGNLIELLYFYSPSKNMDNDNTTKNFFNHGYSHIAFTVGNLNLEYERLSKEGVKFISSPQVSPDNYAKVAFCRDFEDNLIELVEIL